MQRFEKRDTMRLRMAQNANGTKVNVKKFERGVKPDEYDENRKQKEISYILFKNAYNGSGTVKPEDEIKDYTCIEWTMPWEKLLPVCNDLQGQLGSEYTVEVPDTEKRCIIILKNK